VAALGSESSVGGNGATSTRASSGDVPARIGVKTILTTAASLTVLTGCAGLMRTTGDRALCESDPIDRGERWASRKIDR